VELIVVAFVILFIGLAVLGWYQSRKRRKAMMAFARRNGLAFDHGKDRNMEHAFPGFKCLRQGSGRYAYNRLWGDWNGRELLGFDYHYQTGSGKDTTHHHFSAVILAAGVPLEPLVIRPEGFFDKVREFFGYDDIDFESAAFSREFYVSSPNRKWAYDVIHTRTMELLLTSPRFTIQFDRRHVIAYRSRRFRIRDFSQAAAVARGVLDQLPDYVIQQQRDVSS
jgi:hypothetical protein